MCGIQIRPYRCGHERRHRNICWEARMRPYPRGGNPDPCPGDPDGERRGATANFCCKPECCAQEFDNFYAGWERFSRTRSGDIDWQERRWRARERELVAFHAECRVEQDDLYEM